MAEFLFRKMAKEENLDVAVKSAATSTEEIGNPVHPGTRKKLSEFNISVSGKYAELFMKSDYKKYDYIIVMDSNNLRNLFSIIGSDTDKKVFKLLDFADGGDIRDPWYTGNFDETYDDISKGLKGLIKHLKVF